jgi:hypothetical protein
VHMCCSGSLVLLSSVEGSCGLRYPMFSQQWSWTDIPLFEMSEPIGEVRVCYDPQCAEMDSGMQVGALRGGSAVAGG